MTAIKPIAIALLASVLAPIVALDAHGGRYRGPGNPVALLAGLPANGPPVGGPAPTPVPGPVTSAPPGPIPTKGPQTQPGGLLLSDGTSWSVWWEFNKDPFLQLRSAVHAAVATSGSDDFFMGGGNRPEPRDTLAPSARDRREQILPALHRALQGTRNRDITSACLIAMAKIGANGPGIQLVPALQTHLRRKDQEVRETAAVALGITGRAEALPVLLDLLNDTTQGRRLVDRGEVDDRTRAFAAYGIGLLAGRSDDPALKQRAFAALGPVLADRDDRNRDLKVAAVHGIGLLAPDRDRSGVEKRLLWQALEALWGYYDTDLGKGDQLLQAHVPIAIARLLGRGGDAEHQRAKRILVAELSNRRRNNAVHQSAALALGRLCFSGDRHEDDQRCSDALLGYYRKGTDQQARYFCLIALGRIGGVANRAELMKIYQSANKATEKPWAALALGVIGRAFHESATSGRDADGDIGQLLMRDLSEVDNKSALAGIAIGVGLTAYSEAAPRLRALLRKHRRHDLLAGYLCVALALLDDEPSIDQIRAMILGSIRRPFLMQQAAVALGRLGDKRAAALLHDLMPKNDSAASLSAIAAALGFIGDRHSIAPLIAMLEGEDLTKLARAFVAAALGGVGDKDLLPWNTALAVDANYAAVVDTLTNGRTGILDIL